MTDTRHEDVEATSARALARIAELAGAATSLDALLEGIVEELVAAGVLAARASPAIALHVVRADAELRARQQAMVAELGRFVIGGVSRRGLLARAARVVEEGLGAAAVAVLELGEGDALTVLASSGWSSDELAGLGARDAGALHVRAGRSATPIVVADLAAEGPRFLPEVELRRELRSAVAVPIPLGPSRTFGVVVAHGAARAAFGSAHVDFLVAIANIVGESLLRFAEQEQLRASEEMLRLAAEAASVGTWDWFVETGGLTWSPVTKEIYGLSPDEPVDYERFVSFLPESDRRRLEDHVRDALRPDGPGRMDLEHRIRRADGATRWLSAHAQTLFDELRRPVRIVGTTTDVTTQRRMGEVQDFLARASAELAMSLDVGETLRVVARLPVGGFADLALVDLFVSEEELEHAAVATASREHAAVAAALEQSGRVRRGPETLERTFGLAPPRLVRVVDDHALQTMAVDPAIATTFRTLAVRSLMIAPLVARGRAFGVVTFGASSRSFDDVDLALVEQFAARAALAIDNARLFADQVAAREAAEAARAALAESEERRRLALDAASLGTWQWDMATGLIEADDRARKLLVTPDAGTITVEQFLSVVHPEDRERLRKNLQTALERREGDATVEYRVVERDGSVRWLSGTGRVELDARGVPARWVGISQDITRRKLDEQQALAASRAKDEFLAMLGHELRNPLAPISTAVQLMKMRGSKADERERAIIERQVRHLSRLVEDLLDVSRITAGRVKLDVAPVEINEVVAQAIETASPLLEQRRHQLAVDVPRTGLRVNGDAVRLAQVVANLLTNSAKYTNPGGHLRVRAWRDGDAVALSVADDGIGIARELLPRVFDVFAQGAQAIDRSQGGLGLGLAIVKSLVTMHGGTIEADSAGEGKGTEMIVRLPAYGAETESSAPPSASSREVDRGESRRRVLVVDDNADAAELLDAALASAGYEVRTAFDPLAALEIAGEFRPHVGILDVGLPVMDGFELAAQLRERGLTAMHLVAVTGYGQPEDRDRARAAGFEAHLVKPVDVERLTNLLAKLLDAS